MTSANNEALPARNRWTTVWLRKGDLELCLLPGLGGRLWDIRIEGQSLLFQNLDLVGCSLEDQDIARLPTRAPHLGFPIWGGEKTWIAPQSAWPDGAPHPTLDIGAYDLDLFEGGAHLTSSVCPKSGLRVARTIRLNVGASFSIEHRLVNESPNMVATAPWSVMMVRRPLRVRWLSEPQPICTPVFGDAHGCLGHNAGLAEALATHRQEFKVCTDRDRCLFDINGVTFHARATHRPRPRPDGHGALEIYNSGAYEYGEVEWVGALRHLAPGEETEMCVQFQRVPHHQSVKSAQALLEKEQLI